MPKKVKTCTEICQYKLTFLLTNLRTSYTLRHIGESMKFYAILTTVILVFLCAPVMFFVWVMPGRPTLGLDLNSLLMGFMIILLCVSIIALILVFQRYFGRSETDSKPRERTARRTTPVLPVQYIYTQQPPYNPNQISAPSTYALPIPPSDQETNP